MKKITIAILTISILAVGIIGYKTLESTTTKSTASIRDSYNRYDKNNNILTLKSIEITSPTNGNYQEGEKIEFKVTWSGKVYSRLGREIKKVTSPDLYIKFGNGYRKKADFVKQEEDSLYYEYIIRRTDYGKIELVKYEGNVYDRDKSKVIIGEVSLSGNVDITANNQNNNPITPPQNDNEYEDNEEDNEEDDIIIRPPSNDKDDNEVNTKPENDNEDKEDDIIITPPSNDKDDNEVNTKPETKPNTSQMTQKELADFIKNSYNITTGLVNNSSGILSQIKTILKDIPSLTLIDLIRFVKDIQEVYSYEYDTGIKTYNKSAQVARLTTYSNGDNTKGPILIIPGTLHKDNTETPIYWISLGGTEFVDGQATDIATDILTGLELNNDYLISTYNAIIENIPANSNLVITGISLGGMIAQQVASQDAIKEYYNVLNIVTYGSPIITPSKREGTVRRLCDKMDVIPTLSISNSSENIATYDAVEKMVENGGYKTPLSAHTFSYVNEEEWKNYDVLGFKNGTASVTLSLDEMKYYDALLSK